MKNIKIIDTNSEDAILIIETKKNKQDKIEINKMQKISIAVVKKESKTLIVIMMVLLILDLAYVNPEKFKIGIALLIAFLFVALYKFYNKQYTLVIQLQDKEKLKYSIAPRQKVRVKEIVYYARDLQFKQNFRE